MFKISDSHQKVCPENVAKGEEQKKENEKEQADFFPLQNWNENGRNVHYPVTPRGIIIARDAKDSVIRFFNYWGFASPL